MIPSINLTGKLLRLLPIPARDYELVLPLLSIPHCELVPQRDGNANFSGIRRHFVRRHGYRLPPAANSASIVVGVSRMTFSSTMSVVIPSASPSKLRMTRCRIAGVATSLMS
jgi:hypothetical protein